MIKAEYRKARRLVRDNGRYALNWMHPETRDVMDRLLFAIQDSTDHLSERADIIAYCNREGILCNVRHTQPRSNT